MIEHFSPKWTPVGREKVRQTIELAYEARFGFARACILKNNRPHLYLEGFERDPSPTLWGAVTGATLSARVGGVAMLTLLDGSEAVLDGPKADIEAMALGSKMTVQIIAEARADKRPRAKGVADDAAGISDLRSRIVALSQTLVSPDAPQIVVDTDEADELLNEAEAEALSPSGVLVGGGTLSLEPTRAMIAGDVDMGNADAGLIHTAKSKSKSINEAAMRDVGRRLQLSGLSGLVIIDLIGKRVDAEVMRARLLEGFGPEGAQISTGGAGRFGTYEFARPWRTTPHNDVTRRDMRLARQLLWQAASEGQNDGGRMITIASPRPVADIITGCLKNSLDPLSPRLKVQIAPITQVSLT